MIYIFDIDGTLCDISHRLDFIHREPPDWDSFFEACPGDSPIYPVIQVAQSLAVAGFEIDLLSGRSDQVLQKTRDWITRYHVPCHRLYMRKAGDHRNDDVVKAEILEEMLKRRNLPLDQIAGVFEDRDQVVKMYRAKGLRVFQVADGNF